MRLSPYFKTISQVLILAMLHLCWLTSYGYAEMLPTESSVQSHVQDDRQRILDLLDRQEVVEELEKYGITKVEAASRINSLTDEEVTEIAGKLDELPPGGYIQYILLLPFLAFGAMAICLVRMPFCLIFECETSWGACTRSLIPISGGDSGGETYSHRGRVVTYDYDDPNAIKRLDQQVCLFDCDEAQKICVFDSINDGEDTLTANTQCNKEKNTCFQQCKSN